MIKWIKRKLWPDRCPCCGAAFEKTVFWPGIGDYCGPCYSDKGVIVARKAG